MHKSNKDIEVSFKNLILENPSCFSKTYPKGRYFSDIIDGMPCIGFIESGCLDVYLMISSSTEILITTLHAKEFFGFSTLGNRQELQTVLRCRERTDLVFLPQSSFLDILTQNPFALKMYVQYTSSKIQFLLEKMRFHCIPSARNRFITFLLHEMDSEGTLTLDCTREDLARKLGMSRANLFREINFLKKRNILTCTGRRFLIPSIPFLVALLDDP